MEGRIAERVGAMEQQVLCDVAIEERIVFEVGEEDDEDEPEQKSRSQGGDEGAPRV